MCGPTPSAINVSAQSCQILRFQFRVFTSACIRSMICHHDILQLVWMHMLRSARSERKTLTDIAQQELRHAITHGTYQPGSKLPTEAELCEMLGVSRTVVREALRRSEERRVGKGCRSGWVA